MPSLTCFSLRFTPSWLMTILATGLITLFIYLGVWQIHRAQEKKILLAAEQSLALRAPKSWEPQNPLPLQYERLRVQGTYLPHVFLLDNQHQQHEFGYDALTPLLLSNGSVIMIDRGWVLGDSTRKSFQDIPIPEQFMTIEGRAYYPSKNPWVLGPDMEKKDDKIIIVESLNIQLFSEVLQKKVYPFIMRLDKDDAYGFVREWAVISMPPGRHLAYAFQWFVMALVILIIFLALNLKKTHEKTYL